MPALPTGDPAPEDGALPQPALDELGQRAFGFYVHVPFCTVRCGYCDFNTYTAEELGSGPGTVSRATYSGYAVEEVRRARTVLGDRDLPVATVFLGGGTPTLLDPADLAGVIEAIDTNFGMVQDAEITIEANPDSVDPTRLAALREAGINRISFGMQSAIPEVLAVLDRTHDPDGVPRAVAWAREAGFEQISLDLIYGTPGETTAQWETTLDAALACAPDHISAYSLIVEDGTALARRVSRGELPMPDEDDLADKYLLADARFEAAGLGWYEVSNWSRDEASRCRHNMAYWTGADWWGIGPGAHSHVAGVRWWNVKHPAAYADRLARGFSPAAGREVLDEASRGFERLLLEIRLREGLALDALDDAGRATVPALRAEGLVQDGGPQEPLILTLRGRLLADAVVRRISA